MHEASIALSTIEAIREIEKKEGIKAGRVLIEIGSGSGINISSLSFCLKEISKSDFLSINFEIIEVPIEGFCEHCNEKFTLNFLTATCPKCQKLSLNITKGCELQIKEIEGEKIEA